jgi:hypothetical protein
MPGCKIQQPRPDRRVHVSAAEIPATSRVPAKVPAMFIWRHIRPSQNPPAPCSELQPLNRILIRRGMDNITNHMDDSPIRRWKIQPNLLIGVYFQRLTLIGAGKNHLFGPRTFA